MESEPTKGQVQDMYCLKLTSLDFTAGELKELKDLSDALEPLEVAGYLVKNEMSLFEQNSKRPENLEKLFQALLTIPPTSIESERQFSTSSFFATKIRSRLDDSTLSALVFLKSYYKKNKK